MNKTSWELGPVRKVFSRIGLAMCAILLIATALQILLVAIPTVIWGEDTWLHTSSWGMWLSTFAPIYMVAIPIGLLILRKLPAQAPQSHKLGAKAFAQLLPICICVMYAGNLLGTVLSLLLSGGTAENTVANYALDNHPLKILVMVILAPLLEEYVCRKQIIDRTSRFGEKTAVFLSALVFALLHGNLFQFFYAFGLGLIFAYIYTRTGRLRYPVLLHSFINLLGSVIAPWLLSNIDLEAIEAIEKMEATVTEAELMELLTPVLPGFMMFMLYAVLMVGFAIWGLVLLIIKSKRLTWEEAQAQLPKGTAIKTVYLNVGMVLYILLCLVSTVLSLI